MSGHFGSRVRELRLQKRLSLRQFCVESKQDPSNWSKIERGMIPPPTELAAVFQALGLTEADDTWHELSNAAFLEKGMIPKHVLDNEELMTALPVFFRTARGEKPSREELERLIEVIRNS